MQTDGSGDISCALSDSRVLIGECDLHVYGAVPCGERPAHCARPPHPRARKVLLVLRDVRQRHARRDVIPESDKSVRLHRLRGDRLEELARIQLKRPDYTPVAR